MQRRVKWLRIMTFNEINFSRWRAGRIEPGAGGGIDGRWSSIVPSVRGRVLSTFVQRPTADLVHCFLLFDSHVRNQTLVSSSIHKPVIPIKGMDLFFQWIKDPKYTKPSAGGDKRPLGASLGGLKEDTLLFQ